MENKFKEKMKAANFTSKFDSPLAGSKLPKKTELTDELIGKYGVLAHEKFKKKEESDNER